MRFDTGPAMLTRNMPRRQSRKLAGLIGTGFAQPKRNPEATIMRSPIRSKCTSGFSVNRPIYFAVGSPRRFAVQACENSCTVSEKNRIGRLISICCKFVVPPSPATSSQSFQHFTVRHTVPFESAGARSASYTYTPRRRITSTTRRMASINAATLIFILYACATRMCQ
jgi:hypothetical protein